MTYKNRWWLLALAALLSALFCGCSAQEFSLPQAIDLVPGQRYELLRAVRYDGADPETAALMEAAQDPEVLGALETAYAPAGADFTSSDPAVAAVDAGGVLTAGQPGTATVTLASEALGARYEVTVTVLDAPEALTMDSAMSLAVGETRPLDATVTPLAAETAVAYQSANERVATVDPSGVVRGVATGETAIVASVPGSSLTAMCAVQVGDAVQSVSLSRAAVALAPGERTVLAAAVRHGGGDAPAPAWQSSNERVVTAAQDGTLTAVGEGTALVSVLAGGRQANCLVTVSAPATPESATPETATPESATPESAAPEDVSLPLYFAAMASATPETATPETATPETATPETATPETATPETATPETATPETATPETATPESATPETATPETGTPETATPETATPETATPESATPESAVPEDVSLPLYFAAMASATPETATPETATPESATPETATPESATPETAARATAAEQPVAEDVALPLYYGATPESATPESATPETATAESAAPGPATAESGRPGLPEAAAKLGDRLFALLQGIFSWPGNGAESASST